MSLKNLLPLKRASSTGHLLFFITIFMVIPSFSLAQGQTDNSPDWFFPEWVSKAEYNKPVLVRDTDSALGRYSLKLKEVGLKDLARFHGHLCDGLVISFIEIKAVLEKLFPERVVDRTDLRAVSKNGPCWIDAVMYLTGARINFQTLRVDYSIGDGFIIQRISTGEAYEVHLKQGVFPEEQALLEESIRNKRRQGKAVPAEEIDRVEEMANSLIRKILSTPPEEILDIVRLPSYSFRPFDFIGERGDIINKSMPRKK